MVVTVPRQWLVRGATAAVGYQSVVPISKYQGGWQPPAVYPPYVPKKQAYYGHHMFVIPRMRYMDKQGNYSQGNQAEGNTYPRLNKRRKSFGSSTQTVI